MRYRTLWLLRKIDRRKGLSGMSSDGKTDLHHMIKGILWGVLIGETVTVLLLLIFALAMTAASLPLAAADWLSAAAFCMGALAGGFAASAIVKEKGLLTGLLCGIVLMAITFLIGTIFSKIDTSLFLLVKAAGSILFGMLGGILGVNRKHRRIKY